MLHVYRLAYYMFVIARKRGRKRYRIYNKVATILVASDRIAAVPLRIRLKILTAGESGNAQ